MQCLCNGKVGCKWCHGTGYPDTLNKQRTLRIADALRRCGPVTEAQPVLFNDGGTAVHLKIMAGTIEESAWIPVR